MSKSTHVAKIRQQAEQLEKLAVHVGQMQRERRQINAILCALLQQYHGGKADINATLALEWANNFKSGVGFREFPDLKILEVTAEKDISARIEQQKLAVVEDSPAPEEEASAPPACDDCWHSDENAMGARCPKCGSNQKVVEQLEGL